MNRILLGLALAGLLETAARADVVIPKTKPTASKPKQESEAVPNPFGGPTVFAGAALSMAVVTGGLVLIRRRQPRASM
jgi:hypothetical protein